VHGEEHLASLKGPAIFVSNHSSHFDAYLLMALLPLRLRLRTAMAAAADRWYARKKWKANWYSLLVNIYPIQRGGGRAALSYSEELLGKGWSLVIFPEGTRAKRGHMEAFKFGVAILALGQGVPIVPFHFKGTAGILPPRERHLRKAPVEATIGAPVSFASGTSLPEAVAQLQEAVRVLAGEPDEPTAERKSEAA
jgi:1-acyl-sn-glycerol-3-phosphate acyltransferase